jgi:secondary thiamine-phosphate synthase enzyme
MQTLELATTARTACTEITKGVQRAVSESGVTRGVVVVCSAHTTAGVTINENADPDVMDDVMAALDRLAPPHGPYTHAEGNSDAHVKASLLGVSVAVPIEEGRLVLGTWQGIYFCEFDGRRTRQFYVKVIPG